jgi:hypothetical protein
MSSPGGGNGNSRALADETANKAARGRQRVTAKARDNIREFLTKKVGNI